MSVKVSVIVPVYNPGEHIDHCITSLLEQSLPADEYEAIFVDDGSTDATPARLDALAAEHPHVHVEHIPNSGWPGKPRNVGIEMAQGEYVYFVDNDDWIERDALERMYAMAVDDDAEIVVGKVVGHGKPVSRGLFSENLHGVDLHHTRLLTLLSPHKLFRRSLLDEHGIRFPEGRRRLEDHMFVVHAYFHAQRISVLADHPCYHWAFHGSKANASHQRLDPVGYFGNVREVLDLVEAHTEPGAFRDRLMLHWYRSKLLPRVGGRAFTKREPEYNRELYAAIRDLALDRYRPDVADSLRLNLRVRSHLLREDSYEALVTLAERESDLKARVRATRLRGDGTWLRIDVRAELTGSHHGRLLFRPAGDRMLWVPPEGLADALPEDVLDATAALEDASVQLMLVSIEDQVEWQLDGATEVRLKPVEGQPEGTVRVVLRTTAVIAPTVAAAGHPLAPGEWELQAAVSVGGFSDKRSVMRDKHPVRFTSIPPARLDPRRATPVVVESLAAQGLRGLRSLLRRARALGARRR